MHKKYFIFLLLINNGLYAQTAVSGRLDLKDDRIWEKKVYLYQLDLQGLQDQVEAKEVAWSTLATDGSFSFEAKYLSNQDAFYQLKLYPSERKLNDTIVKSRPFILSRRDKLNFESGNPLFEKYTTTNLADKEWKRLRDFEQKLQQSNTKRVEDIRQTKGYIKDSLRILIVKLIGIQQLEDKNLLDQDIAKNPAYYLTLLGAFQESQLPSYQYLFLEKKLAFLKEKVVEQKYKWSRAINIFLMALVLGLVYMVFYTKKQRTSLPILSKQEQAIKKFILEGKSNKEIANELFISLSTVKTHITNIYSKLKVSNRQELLQKMQNKYWY